MRAAASMSILIVDDEWIAQELLRDALEEAGFEVVVASNGREALEILEERDIRMVITDWEMPEMSGIELCREIRRRGFHGYTFIILLTSRKSTDEIVEGMSAGADDFMAKPFNSAELLVRLRAGERILALETRELLIFALAKLAESRDPETGRHLERVQRYSHVLAKRLSQRPRYAGEIDPELIHLIYLTSPLHDIGKVGIPDSVLLKPGRLSEAEFNIMKTHAAIGAETLDAALQSNPSARFLRVARDIAIGHHERFDGAGYPRGLAGQDIPLAARIVAVADVFDALTSKRVYKDAMTPAVARQIIEKETGKQFDPEIVAAFLDLESQFHEIHDELNENNAEPSQLHGEHSPQIASAQGSTSFQPIGVA